MPRRIESVFIPGPAGRLEALLEEPEDSASGHTEPRQAALVCHPHPQHGGTMHNKVVHRIARALRQSGFAVLRFNYRGVNLSEGKYDRGEGELEDARTALGYLRARYPDLPFTLAGFSFGSRIALRLGCEGVGARQVIAVGFPTSYDRTFLQACTVPRVFIQSTHDEFGPLEQWLPMFDSLPEPKQKILIESKDHFFVDALEELEEEIAGLG
ncbi:MAG TPA: alpha/beta fold hydrolase [Bryobacteraceae bacterium]